MKNISVSRMTLLLRRDLFSNWKRHLLQLGIIYALLTVFLCGKYYGYFSPFDLEAFKASHPAMLQAYLEQKQAYISSSVVGIGLFYFLFVLSTSFAGISTKQQRISALMLPATNMEKYLTGILSAIVRTFLFMTVGVVLADLTRMAIMPFSMSRWARCSRASVSMAYTIMSASSLSVSHPRQSITTMVGLTKHGLAIRFLR